MKTEGAQQKPLSLRLRLVALAVLLLTVSLGLVGFALETDNELEHARTKLKKKNLDLAERIENKNQIKYSEGLASSFELRQAQTQLYSVQQKYLQSMVDVINNPQQLSITSLISDEKNNRFAANRNDHHSKLPE